MWVDPLCLLCRNYFPTIHHIFSNCPEALKQDQHYLHGDTHGCALKIVTGLKRHLEHGDQLNVDLPAYRASEIHPLQYQRTFWTPPSDQILRWLGIMESFWWNLPYPTMCKSPENLVNANVQNQKRTIYHLALWDLDAAGCDSAQFTIEIGALGHWLPQSCKTILEAVPTITKAEATNLIDLQRWNSFQPCIPSLRQDMMPAGTPLDHCSNFLLPVFLLS